jgi:hypothetical protein
MMYQLEKEFLKLKAMVVETRLDEDLRKKANKAEREFYKSVLKLSLHSNTQTKWKGGGNSGMPSMFVRDWSGICKTSRK